VALEAVDGFAVGFAFGAFALEAGLGLGVAAGAGDATLWMAVLIWRLPPRSRRWRLVLPELTGIGAMPPARASLASLAKRWAPAISPISLPAVNGPKPGSASSCGATWARARRSRPRAGRWCGTARAGSPELLLQRAHHLDHGIVRRGVELAEAVHALARPLGHLAQAVGQQAHEFRIRDRAAPDGLQLTRRRHRTGLPVREVPIATGASATVAQVMPGLHELVELEVQRAEVAADDRPVQLLADQREVDRSTSIAWSSPPTASRSCAPMAGTLVRLEVAVRCRSIRRARVAIGIRATPSRAHDGPAAPQGRRERSPPSAHQRRRRSTVRRQPDEEAIRGRPGAQAERRAQRVALRTRQSARRPSIGAHSACRPANASSISDSTPAARTIRLPPRRPTGAEAGRSCRLPPRSGEPARGSGPRALPRRVAPARRARGHNRVNPTASMPQAPRGTLPLDRKRRGSSVGTVLSSRG
jgi:hypothetical protein